MKLKNNNEKIDQTNDPSQHDQLIKFTTQVMRPE
jgi:hypothetical protein